MDCPQDRRNDVFFALGLLRRKTDISLTLFSLSRYGHMGLSAPIFAW
jgi:hypothetical protein